MVVALQYKQTTVIIKTTVGNQLNGCLDWIIYKIIKFKKCQKKRKKIFSYWVHNQQVQASYLQECDGANLDNPEFSNSNYK